VTLYKNPSCTCCEGYVQYLEQNGFKVDVRPTNDLAEISRKAGIPEELEGCHTSFIGNYVVDGHVPVKTIRKLLDEKPAIAGITLPGMPSGSPGMSGEKTSPLTVFGDQPRQHAATRIRCRLAKEEAWKPSRLVQPFAAHSQWPAWAAIASFSVRPRSLRSPNRGMAMELARRDRRRAVAPERGTLRRYVCARPVHASDGEQFVPFGERGTTACTARPERIEDSSDQTTNQ
jgi:hypothetical protein